MTDRRSGMIQSLGYPQTSTIVSRAVAAAAANNHHHSIRRGGRGSKRYSVSAFYSMAAEQDVEVEDDLARGAVFLYVGYCPVFGPLLTLSDTLQLNVISASLNQRYQHSLKRTLCWNATSDFWILGSLCLSRIAWRWTRYSPISASISNTFTQKSYIYVAKRSSIAFRRAWWG